eukprot:CAMPEP_0202868902 /NCGR_PEP_ID=MMETSP1391-20130828/11342_1 /ASSEMBLY_ACC=CAM_ASM_000867 /TAXON_ID=1034604 /ORGANISM="Chlamydomonas leiostraca, Strain SAG 11-49" /LENGTH=233 /DNA_ID=CAMNT_0049549127 /DNA_START=82 /DNA_END=783 /DNA_ORIENTATION=-
MGLMPLKMSGSDCKHRTSQNSRCPAPAQPLNPTSYIARSQAEPAAPAPVPAADPAAVEGALKGCRTLLAELQGLDFPNAQVRQYFQFSTKMPKTFTAAADLDSARATVALLMKVDEEGDKLTAAAFKDLPALQLTQAMMTELWRWRRRGGGMDDESDSQPYAVALREIQNFKPEDIDRISSSLLDRLDLSDAQKKEMSGAVQQAAVGAMGGAVWGSLVLALAFLAVFNFVRGG